MYCRCLARAGRGRLLVSASATFCGPAQFRVWEGGLQAVDVPQWQPGCAKERAEGKAERERANLQRQVRRLQGACNVSDDEAVSDEENAQLCLLSPLASLNLLLSDATMRSHQRVRGETQRQRVVSGR